MCAEKLGPTPTELCGKFACPPEALELAEGFPEPAAFISELRSANMSLEAVQALARMLPPDKAVAWAELSAQMAGEKVGMSAEESEALEAARAWTLDPCEETRAAAELAATKVPASAPAMWTAQAAVWSTPAELPERALPFPDAEDLTARAVAGAVQLSAALVALGRPIDPSLAPAQDAPALAQRSALEEGVAPELPALTNEERAAAAQILEPFLEQGVGLASSVPGFKFSAPLRAAARELG